MVKAGQAKERSVTSQEEEYAKLTFTEVQMELSQGNTVDSTAFQKMIDGNFGSGNATGTIGGGNYIITITRNGTNYKMGSSGKIETLDELPIDFEPGVLEKSGNIYTINSIEDLVAFSYNVNSGAELYEGKIVTLGRDLDFQDDNSYVDANSKYKKDENGYTPDSTSATTIKTLVTTDIGFVPIGDYSKGFVGKFDGKNYCLKNIYVKSNLACGGVFGFIKDESIISNLGVKSGSIYAAGYSGGICGVLSNSKIDNCYNGANIDSANSGGIVGFSNGSVSIISNCYNTGNITAYSPVGGICGIGNPEIINCYNKREISSSTTNAAGIAGEASKVINCCNLSNIISEKYSASGIMMSSGSNISVLNCYNAGEITGKQGSFGICCNNTRNKKTINIENCFNTGEIKGKNEYSSFGAGILSYNNQGNDVITLKNCYNSGIINTDQFTNSGEIIGEGEVSSDNYYQKRDSNANSNGSTGKDNLSEVITLQKFVDSMNSYVEENNLDSTKTKLKTWKVENGMPVFAE